MKTKQLSNQLSFELIVNQNELYLASMKKLITVFIFFISISNPIFSQNKVGSKDCSTAPTLCNNDVINEKLVGPRGVRGANDIPTNFNSCFKPKTEFNPFWYKFTAENSGNFEMYLNAKQEGVDFDYIFFDVTNGCVSKEVKLCNSSQLDLDSNNIGTGISSDSMLLHEPLNPGPENSWAESYPLVAGRTYAIYIESRQLRQSDSAFTITFGGDAQFRNVISDFTFAASQCFGKPVTFTNTSVGGFTYIWDFGDGKTSTTFSPSHNYSNAGTYKVKLKAFSSSGCVDTDSAMIAINVAFNPFAGDDLQICKGSITTLTGSGGVSYSWNTIPPTSSIPGQTISVSPASTTTYILTAKDNNNCSGTDEVTVTVKDLPIATVSGDVTICNGETTPLSASGGLSYSWTPTSGLSATNIANPIASPSVTTKYTVTVKDINTCESQASVTVTVNPSPLIKAGNDATICAGESTQLNATGGTSYTWDPGTGLSANNIANPIASPTNTTTYIVSGRDLKNCLGRDTITVKVNPLPIVSAGNPITICNGSSTTLSATGALSYLWTPNENLSADNISNPIASPTITKTYTVTGTDALTCKNTSTVTITVNDKPTITTSPNISICTGEFTTLNASGASTYTWSPPIGLSSTNIANPIANPVTTTTYTVTGKDVNDCENVASVTVTANPLPVIDAGSDVTICNGKNTTLNASGAMSYVWNNTPTLSSLNINNPIANPSATETYIVTGQDALGCKGTDNVIVNVNALPTVSAGTNISICTGQSTTLNAAGASSYTWSPNTALSSTTIANPIANPTNTQLYTVKGVDGNFCEASASVLVTVNSLPTVSAGNDVTICNGTSTTLQATGAATYTWSPINDLSSSTISNPGANPEADVTYTVIGRDLNGCFGSSDVTVKVDPSPIVSAGNNIEICSGQSTTLNATGASSYSWSGAGLSSTSIANPVASPTTTTTYTVTGLNGFNCTGTSSVTVTVNPLPIVDAGSDVAICKGNSTTLGASGAQNYSWLPVTDLSINNISNPVATPPATSKYVVTGSDGKGCSNKDSLIITVNPLSTADAGNDVTLCSGQATTLNASGGTSFQWIANASLSSTTISNPVANPTVTTKYFVTVKDVNGCEGTDSVLVNVNPVPVVSAGNNVEICSGQSTNLIATGASSYSWSGNGLSSLTIANPIATPTTTTTYNVTGVNGTGCSNTASVIVTVNTLPLVNAGSDVTICEESSTQLNASGALNYTWSGPDLSSTTIANPVASPLNTIQYTVSGIDGKGCTNKDSLIVTVDTLPFIDAGNDTTICNGATTTLNASGGTSYSWTSNPSLSATNISNPVASPSSSTEFFVTIKDNNGCQGIDSVFVNVNPVPVVSAGSNVEICTGQSTTLNATGAMNYSWSGAGLSSSTIANPVATPTITTTYMVTSFNNTGCSNTASVTVTVNSLPVIDAGNDVAICEGNSTQLNATGAQTYTWSPPTNLSSASISNPIATPTITTKYIVSGVNGSGCSNKDSLIVTVNPLSTADAGNDVTICSGETTTLNASGGTSYNWATNASLSATTIPNPLAKPTVTTKYFVTVSDVNGCQGTDSVVVNVNPIPVVSAGNNIEICSGQSTTLNATGASSYSWSGAGLSSTTIPNPVASPTTTTTYTVTGLNSFNCSGTSSVTVTVNPLPIVNAGSDVAICKGNSTALSASGAQNYSWLPVTGLSNNTIPNPVATPSATSKYVVTGSDVKGCSNKDSLTITVNPLSSADAGNDVTLCNGQTTTLNASGGASFQWNANASLSSTTISNPAANPTITTKYFVTVKDINGCEGTDSVTVNVNPLPVVSAGNNVEICSGQSTNLLATGASSYSWTSDGLSSSTIANPIATPTTTTTYVVTGLNSTGCSNTASVTVTVNALPIADAGIDVTICEGNSTQLNATGGQTYSWSPANGLSDSNINNPLAKPMITTNYTVIGMTSKGCKDSAEVTVFVNPQPIIDAGKDVTICNGQSTNLIATGGSNYTWSLDPSLSSTTIANPVASPSVTTLYKVSANDVNNCSGKDSVLVTVNFITVGVSNDTTICSGLSTQLNATGGDIYKWSPAKGLSDVNISNPVASPLVKTTYKVNITDINGCINSDSITVDVNTLPSASAGADKDICQGNSVKMDASGGSFYAWLPSTGLSDTTIANPIATPKITTDYTVTIKDINGCKGTDVVQVKVNNLPLIDAGKDTTFCFGNSVTLNATGGTKYQWDPSSTLSLDNISNPIATPNVSTTYYVSVMDANNCTGKDSVKVGVTFINVSAGANDTICNGTSAQLNASGGNSYSWSPTTSLSNALIPNPVANPTSTTPYTVTVKDNNGCTNKSTVTVFVNPKPNFDAGSDISFCNGKNGNLNAVGTGSIKWSPTNGLSNATIFNPVAAPNQTTTYIATLTDANGCQNIDSAKVTVNFIKITKGNNFSVCQGTPAQLFASGGTIYKWTPANGLNDKDVANPIATPKNSTTYKVDVTDGNGCSNSDSIVVTVNGLPTVSAGNNTKICNGNSVQLLATGGNNYTWSPPTGLSNINTPNPIASPSIKTSYIVKAQGLNGCSNTDTVVVDVNYITIAVSNGTSICAGNTAQLMATGGSNYSWSPDLNLDNANSANPKASPLNTITYKVMVTDANGCKNTDSVLVSVNTIATNVSNDTTICFGDTTMLQATGGNKYVWTPSLGLTNSTNSNVKASPSNTQKYIVEVTDTKGCKAFDSVMVNINQLPATTASKDTSICNGKSTQLVASGGTTYLWSPVTGVSDPTIANPVVTPIVPTNYIVRVKGSNGCFNKDTSFVNVTYINITSSKDTTICEGITVPLQSSGGVKYEWTPALGLSDVNIANPLAKPNDSTNYIVTITDNNGCKNSATVNVNVHRFPVAFAGKDLSLCLGKTDTLHATGGTKYLWIPATGLSSATIAKPLITPKNSSEYIVKVSDNIGCTTEDTVQVNVTISVDGTASATPADYCPGQSITLSAQAGSGVSTPAQPYSFDGGKSFQSTNKFIIPSVNKDTIALVLIKDLNGCMSDSIKLAITQKVLKATAMEVSPASCSIESNGIGKLANASGGTSPYSYALDGGSSGPDSVFKSVAAGNHQITLRDSTGCTASFSFTISKQASIVSQISKLDPICAGDTTGQITITASGGSGLGFKYSLDNGAFQLNNKFINIVEGLHQIVIRDSVACFDTLATIISTPDPVTIEVTDLKNVLCNGGKTGILNLTATGGTPNYVFSLGSSLFQPSFNFANLGSGAYTAVVKDANGCKDSSTVFLKQPDTLSAKIAITQVPLCNGVNGEIQLNNVAGGTPGYLKGIDGKTPGTSNSFTNLLPGSHIIKIVDRNGCNRTYDIVLPGDPNSISGTVNIDSISCNIGANGAIKLNKLSGGTRPYQFSLNNQNSFKADSEFVNLSKGVYTIFAKNNNNCLSQFAVNLTEPAPIQTTVISQNAITCYGKKDGAISIRGLGGNSGYEYALNGGFVNDGIFTGLSAKKDTIIIKDIKGCENIFSFEITQPDSIKAVVSQVSPALCGVADGIAKITSLSGGTGSHKYSINGGITFQTDSTFRFLKSGSYSVIFKDIQGCSAITAFNISQKDGGLEIDKIKKTTTDLSCNNANIGSIALSNLKGGSLPYLFSIDSIATLKTDSSFAGLGAGLHTVHIKDGIGCSYDISFAINQPQPINFQLDVTKVESCNSSNGIIKISNVVGGNNTYLYRLDNGTFQDSLTFRALASGLHTVDVKDSSAGSCQTSKSIKLNKKPVPDATITTTDPLCYGYDNGLMVIDTVIGGEVPYTYSLDGINFQNTLIFEKLSADTFTLYIKDSECPNPFIDLKTVYTYGKDSVITDTTIFTYFVLQQPDSIYAETFTIPADRSASGGIFGFFNLKGGHGGYSYSLDKINYSPVVSDTTVIQNLSSGDYFVYLKDNKTCPLELKIYLGKSLFVPNLITPNGDGKNEYFEVMALKNNSKLAIFNKWGSRVYYNEDYDNSWNGDGQPDGVYYYELNNGEKKYKGWVEIVR